MKKIPLAIAASLTLSGASFAGHPITSADDPEPEPSGLRGYLEGQYALGDWGGYREKLKEAGVEPFAYYTGIIAGNPEGGFKEGGFTYVDDFWFGVKFDLEKLVGWKGGSLTVSGINRDGRSLTENYVGSQYNSQQCFGGQNVFFYQFVLEQRFFEDKISLKLGRFGASDDFNSSPIYGLYVNNGINGNIRNVLFDTQFSAYPFATWAARLRFDPNKEWNMQVGVYQTWNDVFDRTHKGLNWGIRSEDGVIIMAQVGWTPELFKRPVPTDESADGKSIVDGKSTSTTVMKGMPGHYWIGATYSPWEGFQEFGRADKMGNSYGVYVHADQMVYQERPGSDQGLTLWAASGYYPQENISIVPFQFNTGFLYKGLIPGRGEDRSMLGIIYGRFSSDYAGTVKAVTGGDPNYELVVEAGHRIQLTKFAYIQPDIQWILRPGGTGQIPNALVLGAQFGVTF